MDKNIAIVTGSSSGFGLLCVVELAKRGFEVIATMRDINKADTLLEMAKQQNLMDFIHIYPLDVTSKESLKELQTYLNEFNEIDVLVNNAGFAVGGFCEELSIDDYRKQFETNFFGVIATTQTILPFMRARGKGRIINMSSISGRIGFPGLSAYSSSKYALEGFSESLSLEVKPFGIDVVLIEPGSYRTNIWSSVETINLAPDSPYKAYMASVLNEIEIGEPAYGNPQDVAKLVAQIASQTKSPNFRYPIGKRVKWNIFLKNTLPWQLIEKFILNTIYSKK